MVMLIKRRCPDARSHASGLVPLSASVAGHASAEPSPPSRAHGPFQRRLFALAHRLDRAATALLGALLERQARNRYIQDN